MRLKDIKSRRQMEEALEIASTLSGTTDLEIDIQHAVEVATRSVTRASPVKHLPLKDFLRQFPGGLKGMISSIKALRLDGSQGPTVGESLAFHDDLYPTLAAEIEIAADAYVNEQRTPGLLAGINFSESSDPNEIAIASTSLAYEYHVYVGAWGAWAEDEVVEVLEEILGGSWELLDPSVGLFVSEPDGSRVRSGLWSEEWDTVSLWLTPADLKEWVVDERLEYFSELVDADPKKAVKAFVLDLARTHPDLAKRLKKAKLPTDALAAYAAMYFEDEEIGLQMIKESTGSFGYEGSRGETILEVTKDDLRKVGIGPGSKWWDGAPWKLINLPKEELAYEGVLQRHCVGRPDMGYRDAVEDEQIYVWSLRSRFNKPVLTWEVDREAWDSWSERIELPFRRPTIGPDHYHVVQYGEDPDQLYEKMMEGRAGSIEQIKGKLNRVPPKDAAELKVLTFIFSELAIDRAHVADYQPGAANNPSPRSFDEPCRFAHSRPSKLRPRGRRRRRKPAKRKRSSVDVLRKYLRNV